MRKSTLIRACQDFINSYYGVHGKEDFSYYDEWHKFTFGIDEGFYGIKGKDIYLNIQGTDEDMEWKGHKSSNFNFFLKRISYPKHTHYGKNDKIKVHPGFYEAYSVGRIKILKIVKDFKNIYVIAHSRGAGIGTIAARDIKWHIDNVWETKQKVILITGGSPRVYNWHGAKEFNKCGIISYRLKYRNDIVCNTPWPIFGYKHIGKKITLGKPYIWSPIGIPNDHRPIKYLEGMKKYKKVIT